MVKKLALFTILISGSYLFSMELPSAKVDEVVIECADGNTSIARIIFKAILLNSKTLKNYLESTGQSAAEINEIPLKALSIRQVEFIAKYSTHLGQKSKLIEELSKKDISLFTLQIILKAADYLEIDNLYKAALSVLAKKAVERAKKDPTSANFNELTNDLDHALVAAMIESDPEFLTDFFANIKIESIFERKETYRVSRQKPAAMAISPNGKTLAMLSGNLIKIIDSESKKEIR